jgi:outer membrane immunogenic protein
MRRLVLFGVGVSGLVGALGADCSRALAADASSPSWTGFYSGLSFGERWDRADWTTNGFIIPGLPGVSPIFPDTIASFGTAPARIGGYFGYNYQINPWVVGLEGDIGDRLGRGKSIVGIPGTGIGLALLAGNNTSQTTVDPTWDASIRARAGYLIAPNVLLYGTGGAAFQHIGETIFCSAEIPASGGCGLAGSPNVTSSVETTLVGWTVGGGIEAALTGQWLLRLDYRYADFGTFDHTFALGPTAAGDPVVATRVATHLMNLGLAYKFGAPAASVADAPIPRKAPAAADPSWTGLYGGLALGGRHTNAEWTTTNLAFDTVPFADNQASFDDTAFRYGGYAGFNYQIGRVVTGVEGGAGTVSNSTKTIPGVPGLGGTPLPGGDSTSVGTNWDANVVARLGYLVAPDVLLYGVGGAAVQNVTLTAICTNSPVSGECFSNHSESLSTTQSGPTWGVGIETMFWHNWLARLDYRYADFGTINHTFFVDESFSSPTTSTAIHTQTLTLGIAYKFGPGG